MDMLEWLVAVLVAGEYERDLDSGLEGSGDVAEGGDSWVLPWAACREGPGSQCSCSRSSGSGDSGLPPWSGAESNTGAIGPVLAKPFDSISTSGGSSGKR